MNKYPDLNRYEKRIIINDYTNRDLLQTCVVNLIQCMFVTCEEKEVIEFFRLRFTDSEKHIGAKEMLLEWASIGDPN